MIYTAKLKAADISAEAMIHKAKPYAVYIYRAMNPAVEKLKLKSANEQFLRKTRYNRL